MKFIPEQLKTVVIAHGHESNAAWEQFATMDGEEVPADELNAMQVRLCRWQRANFGDVSPTAKVDCHMTLGLVEEFGETLGAEEILGDKGKVDGLGDICVYAGQLLNANRLAIAPVMRLADVIADAWEESDKPAPDAIVLAGQLTHVVLKHEQKIRGFDKPEIWFPSLVYQVAALMACAKLDLYWSAREVPDLDADLKWDGLIQRTYIQVAGAVVLKRNWTVDRIAGQNPA